jgi:hypothetical protein
MSTTVNTYSPLDGDVRWRIVPWVNLRVTHAVERGANLLLLEGDRVALDAPAAETLRHLANVERNNAIARIEQSRREWLSYNTTSEEGRRNQARLNPRPGPRVADALDVSAMVDGELRGPYKRGFPEEAALNTLRAGTPDVPASVAAAAAAWKWERLS